MDLMEHSLKAKYQVNKNLFVICYLDIIDATSEGFKAQIGIRVPGDTVIPVGTKLYLALHPTRPFAMEEDDFETFYVLVQGVEIQHGLPVQTCSPILRERRKNKRGIERRESHFEVKLQQIEGRSFTAMNGTLRGLTLMYQATGMFIGVVLGSTYQLDTAYKETPLSFPVRIAHIHYDWYSNQHLMGVRILEMSPREEPYFMRLIQPPPAGGYDQSASVDTEEALIRHDGF